MFPPQAAGSTGALVGPFGHMQPQPVGPARPIDPRFGGGGFGGDPRMNPIGGPERPVGPFPVNPGQPPMMPAPGGGPPQWGGGPPQGFDPRMPPGGGFGGPPQWGGMPPRGIDPRMPMRPGNLVNYGGLV